MFDDVDKKQTNVLIIFAFLLRISILRSPSQSPILTPNPTPLERSITDKTTVLISTDKTIVFFSTDKTTVFFIIWIKQLCSSYYFHCYGKEVSKPCSLNDIDQPLTVNEKNYILIQCQTIMKHTQLSFTMGPSTYEAMWLVRLNRYCTSDEPFILFSVPNDLCTV